MAAGGVGWPLTSHLTSQSECHPLPDSHMPLYCGTLSSDRNLLGGGESEALTEGQGDPETSFPSAGEKAALMQTPGRTVCYVNGAPCSCTGHRLHASKLQPWGRSPRTTGQLAGGEQSCSLPGETVKLLVPSAARELLSPKSWFSACTHQNHLCRCGKLHMPSLIRAWGWAPIWVVLKGPQMVLTHSQSTAGPHASLEHFHPHPRLAMVGWSTVPKLLSPAQLSSLSPGYKFSHFLNISTMVIHRSPQLRITDTELMSSCPQPASAPGAPARMNPLHPVTQTKGRLSYGPTPSNLTPTEFSKRCGPERAPKAPHSPHNSASDSSLPQKPPDIPPNHPPHCSQS